MPFPTVGAVTVCYDHSDFESVFVRRAENSVLRAKLCYNPPCVCPAGPITFHLVFPVLLLEEKNLKIHF